MKKLMKFAICLLGAGGLVVSAAAQDVISTAIGGGPNGIPGINANNYQPYEVAVDSSNNIYFAALQLNRIFKISTTGIVTVVAGNGVAGYKGDNGLATEAELYNPIGVAVDSSDNVYIGDYNNCLIRKVTASTGKISTIAGVVITPTSGAPYTQCGYNGNGIKANTANLNGPQGVAVNSTTGDVYFTEFYSGVVRKNPGGSPTADIVLVAGSGGSSTSGQNCGGSAPYGDTGTATSAFLCYPNAVAIDTSVSPANVFVTQSASGNRCDVQEVVGSSGKIYEVAGSVTLGCGFTDNVNALKGQLYDPWQMHLTVSGSTTTMQVADYNNARIRQFTLTYASSVPTPGNISTIAGKGENGWCNDDGESALDVCMGPVGIAYDSSGNYYEGDYGAQRIRKVTKSNGFISTIDGWGPDGGTQVSFSNPVGLSGEVGGTPSLYYPVGVYANPTTGYVYAGGYYGQAYYKWNSATNEIYSFAGSGQPGFAGDGSAASSTATNLNYPEGLAQDSSGNTFIADSNNCAIREVNTGGDISTVAGGTSGSLKGCGYTNTSAVDSQFNQPVAIAIDSSNNKYISDLYNYAIRKITESTQEVTTIAGGNGSGFSGDAGPATAAQISSPEGITLDGAGNIYFADYNNQRIREIVALTGILQTVAGTGQAGYDGDGPAVERELYYPVGVVSDPSGNLFIADYDNNLLRWVTPTGAMITFAGTPPGGPTASNGFSGDGGPALKAQLYQPEMISRDGSGNIYVADYQNFRIREVTPFAGYGLSTANLSFETQPTGTTSDFQAVTVSAVGPTTISNITATTGFSEIDDCVGESLTANQNCEIDVYFSPTAPGKDYGSITLTSNAFFAANPHIISVSGVGGGLKITGSLAFGTIPLKTATPLTVTLTASGTAVTLDKIYMSSTTYYSITGGTCPDAGGPLAANASCTIIVTYDPTVLGSDKSTLVVTSSDPASPLLTQATGTGTEVKTSLSSIAFGSISYGTNKTIDLTISNTGTASFTLAETISGAGFSVSSTGKTCTTSLAAGTSCVLPIEYDPSAVGTNSGTLSLTTNGGSSPVLPLSGTATTDASVSPTSLAFGTITHGTTKTMDLTVKNVGTIASLSVGTSITGTGSADFTVLSTGNTCTSGVAPGDTCTLPVEFKPAAAAAYSATLTITTNGGSNPTVALTGTGD
jgi:hypothetical protein